MQAPAFTNRVSVIRRAADPPLPAPTMAAPSLGLTTEESLFIDSRVEQTRQLVLRLKESR